MSVWSLVRTKRAVFFDLFHTLTALEIIPGVERPGTHEMLGVPKDAWNAQLLENSRDRLVGIARDPVRFVTNMAHAIDPTISQERILAAVANRRERFRAALVQMPQETIRVLRSLKQHGRRLGLISNADVLEVAAWNACPAAALFDVTIFSCEVGLVKPEPAIYELGLRRLGVTAKESLFVGDGGSDELQGARRVGLTAVMVQGIARQVWPEKLAERAAQADAVIETLGELLAP